MKKLLLLLSLLTLTHLSLTSNAAFAEDEKSQVKVKHFTQSEIDDLLKSRLNGGLGGTFASFTNQFFVNSALQISHPVCLGASSNEISSKRLMPTFPQTYQPTLKELLDNLALQTHSTWKYNPTGEYIHVSADPEGKKPSTSKEQIDAAIFEFTPTKREKPFSVELISGWTPTDMGHWIKYSPTSFPVGMDIYEMGTYSSDDAKGAEALKNIPSDIILEWSKIIKQSPTKSDLKNAKIGKFDALVYECELTGKDGNQLKWHNWVFMDGNKCYFILSAYPNELENKIFPDVQKMLASFKTKI